MDISAEAKAGTKSIKENWLFFLALGALVGIGFLWWDHKKSGGLTTWLASKPLVGKLFA
jgi:hypothetical protein